MSQVTLFARDNDLPGNREIVAFFQQYLKPLVSAGLRFEFRIVDTTIENELVKRNITKLPAIEIKKSSGTVAYQTPIEIKSALLKYISHTQIRASNGVRRAEDVMNDYYADEMNMDKYEKDKNDEDDGDTKRDLMSKVHDAQAARDEEHAKRNPPKSGQSRRRVANVADEPIIPVYRPPTRSGAPADRIRAVGGDPSNKDDSLLHAMMETSDD